MMGRRRSQERWFYLLILPWIVGLIAFQAGPIVGAAAISFTDWQLAQPPQFVGLAQYIRLIDEPLVTKALINSAYYAFTTVPLGIIVGLGLALLIHQTGRRMQLFFRTVFFLPVVVSGVAMALMWNWLFNPRFGLINIVLSYVGIHGPAWFQNEQWAMPALIIISVWQVGVTVLIYLVALGNVPTHLYDAAKIDGANTWARLRYITLPLISPITFYLIIVNLIGSFQTFTPTYILTEGGPNNATLTLPLYIYLSAFRDSNIAFAAALSVLLFGVILGLTWVQFRLGRRWVFYVGGS